MYNELFIETKSAKVAFARDGYLGQWREHYQEHYVKKCYSCNEEFDMYPIADKEWIYKLTLNKTKYYFCSWTCKCQFEKSKGIYNKLNRHYEKKKEENKK